MGTPVIALQGDRIISRQSACMLESVGLSRFIAQSAEEFAAMGRYWAEHREELQQLRLQLRQTMAGSLLTNGVRYTQQLEKHLTAIWDDFLEKQQKNVEAT